jgi:hypothetical protein
MKISKVILLLICLSPVSSFLGCSSKAERELESKFSQEIVLIDSLRSFQINRGWVLRPKSDSYKLVTYVDGTCGQCIYELENWKSFVEKEKLSDVQFIVFVRTLDLKVIEELLKQVGFDYPVIIDYEDSFSIANELSPKRIEQTFLLDQNNKIVLIGNPLYDIHVKQLYLKTIRGLS